MVSWVWSNSVDPGLGRMHFQRFPVLLQNHSVTYEHSHCLISSVNCRLLAAFLPCRSAFLQGGEAEKGLFFT